VALAWPVARAPEWLRSLLPPNYGALGVPVARPVERSSIGDSLRARPSLAYVISLPRGASPICSAGDPIVRALLDSGLSLMPLVDTRAHFVHRNGVGRVVVDGDGVIRFTSRLP
jgi:hypothetical protein